jgi:hypothetical protein
MIMEEDSILTYFHQEVQKARDKAWHDRHIKRKKFKEVDLVLVYDSKSLQCLGKLKMNWLGPYEVTIITYGGVV